MYSHAKKGSLVAAKDGWRHARTCKTIQVTVAPPGERYVNNSRSTRNQITSAASESNQLFETRLQGVVENAEASFNTDTSFDTLYICKYILNNTGQNNDPEWRNENLWKIPWAGAKQCLNGNEIDSPTMRLAMSYLLECDKLASPEDFKHFRLQIHIGYAALGLGWLDTAETHFKVAEKFLAKQAAAKTKEARSKQKEGKVARAEAEEAEALRRAMDANCK